MVITRSHCTSNGRMEELVATLRNVNASREAMTKAAHQLQALAALKQLSTILPFLPDYVHDDVTTTAVDPSDRPMYVTRNDGQMSIGYSRDIIDNYVSFEQTDLGKTSVKEQTSSFTSVTTERYKMVDGNHIFPYMSTSSTTKTPLRARAGNDVLFALHQPSAIRNVPRSRMPAVIFPYIPPPTSSLISTINSRTNPEVQLSNPLPAPIDDIRSGRQVRVPWLTGLVHLIGGVFTRAGTTITQIAGRVAQLSAGAAARATQVVAPAMARFEAFKIATTAATPNWAKNVLKFVGDKIVKPAPIGASIGATTYAADKLLQYLDRSAMIAQIGTATIENNEQLVNEVNFFRTSLRGLWSSLTDSHPKLTKAVTRALGLISTGLLSHAETLAASRLFYHENLSSLNVFNRDAIKELAVASNATTKEMTQLVDIRGLTDLHSTLSKLDIVEADRQLKTKQNDSVADFPAEVPEGPFKVIDALRINLQRTPEEHINLRQLIYKAAEEDKVAHWSNLMDSNYESFRSEDDDDNEDDKDYMTSDGYRTASSDIDDLSEEDLSWRRYNKQQDALDAEVQSLERQERALSTTITPTSHIAVPQTLDIADRDGLGQRIKKLFMDIYEEMKLEIVYSPRRHMYAMIIGTVITLIVFSCYFCLRRLLCRSQPRRPTHHHEELQTFDVSEHDKPIRTKTKIYADRHTV